MRTFALPCMVLAIVGCGGSVQTGPTGTGVDASDAPGMDADATDVSAPPTDADASAADAPAEAEAAAADSSALDAGADAPVDAADAPVDAADAPAEAQAAADSSAPDGDADAADGAPPIGEILRACVVATSCSDPGSLLSPSRCLDEFAKTVTRLDDAMPKRLLACAKEKDCAAFRACWGGGLVTVTPNVNSARCSGNTLVAWRTTDAAPAPSLDCSALGAVCADLVTSAITAGCNVQPCVQPWQMACTGATASGCNNYGLYVSVDCSATGRTCRLNGRLADCAGTGAACNGSDPVSCAGSVATYCSSAALATIDCRATGFRTRCADGASPYEPCAVAGTECSASSFVGACTGTSLQVCADGFVTTVDCATLGFTLCDVPAVGYARCRERI